LTTDKVLGIVVGLLTLPATPQPSPTPVVYRVGGDVKAPILVRKVEPECRPSRGEHQLGILILEGIVDANGRIRDLRVVRGPKHSSCSRAALAAIRQWEYKPATRKGVPVDVYLTVTVSDFPMQPDA
jgi:protein TonB